MSQTKELVIGADVRCTDGACGQLRRVVIDPVARALTHLVVEPKRRPGSGHLVPVDLIDTTSSQVTLTCTLSQFESLDDAEESQFLDDGDESFGYGREEALYWPYYPLGGAVQGMGGMGIGGVGFGRGLGMGANSGPRVITQDNVPIGKVEIRRGETVHATDGAIGRVEGLIIDPATDHVTHVLLADGHLWGKKTVAIPMSAVTSVTAGVRLNLSQSQLRELPSVDLER